MSQASAPESGDSIPYELSFCAPAYNEGAAIEAVVRGWEQTIAGARVRAEVVITNDGSTDDTGAILARLAAEFDNLRVVHHARNEGYGAALRTAVRAARGHYVATLDSDGQFDPADALRLYDTLRAGRFDVVTGYRDRKRDSLARFLADRALNVLVRLLFGVRYRDTNCALRVYRPETLAAIEIESRGFSAPTEILLKLHALDYRIGEERITHHARTGGASALKVGRTGWRFLRFLLYLRRKIHRYRRGEVSGL